MSEIIITQKTELEGIISDAIRKQFKASKDPKTNKPFTKNEVRDLFQVSLPTIDKWVRTGLIERVSIGKRVYFTYDSISNLLNSKK